MARKFKVPVDAPEITISDKAVGPLADSGTASDLGAAALGTSSQSARSDHAHRTVVVYSTSAPASTDVIWVDTDAVTGGSSGGGGTTSFATILKWGND